MQHPDAGSADFPGHGGNRIPTLRLYFCWHRQLKSFIGAKVRYVRLANALQHILQIFEGWTTPWILCHE
jgi:hypothetical protein